MAESNQFLNIVTGDIQIIVHGPLFSKVAGDLPGGMRSPGEQAVCHWHDKQGKQCCRQYAGQNDDADHHAGLGPGARGENQGDRAGGGGDAGHHDRTQPDFGCFEDGVIERLAPLSELVGKLDDENTILRRQTDQHDQTDLAVQVQGASGQVQSEQPAGNRQ